MICYEQPANEEIRVCIRIEQMFQQIDRYYQVQKTLNFKNILINIIGILNLLDRPDIKLKLSKQIEAHFKNLQLHSESPHIDKEIVTTLMTQLDSYRSVLLNQQGKLYEPLRSTEFIKQISQQILNGHGLCSFDTPILHHWLSHDTSSVIQDIDTWLEQLGLIRDITNLILTLTRKNLKTSQLQTNSGIYQQNLDNTLDFQLFRVFIPEQYSVYPKISAGRQHITIHFYDASHKDRLLPYTQTLNFELHSCFLPKNSHEKLSKNSMSHL